MKCTVLTISMTKSSYGKSSYHPSLLGKVLICEKEQKLNLLSRDNWIYSFHFPFHVRLYTIKSFDDCAPTAEKLLAATDVNMLKKTYTTAVNGNVTGRNLKLTNFVVHFVH